VDSKGIIYTGEVFQGEPILICVASMASPDALAHLGDVDRPLP
jgi:hypothetical protein